MKSSIFQEKNGNRKFTRNSKYNDVIDDIVSRNSSLAKFADNYETGDKKLFVSYIRSGGKVLPLRAYKQLETPVVLPGGVKLTKYNESDGSYLEEKGNKVKLYWEVKE